MISVKSRSREILFIAERESRKSLLEPEAKVICAEYGIPMPQYEVVSSAEEALLAAQKLGFPIVLKIVSPDILHKTEANGVILNVTDNETVRKGFHQIIQDAQSYKSGVRIRGVLVQKMATPGTEVIIGGILDPQFGQVTMFGLGGVFTEIFGDVTFRISPIDEDDAKEMIKEIRGYRLLTGYRDRLPADEGAIVRALLAVSRIMMENPEIGQMDLNPLIVYPDRADLVDARIILR